MSATIHRIFFCLLLFFCSHGLSHAQTAITSRPAESQATDAKLKNLIEVLRDDKAREALLIELEKASLPTDENEVSQPVTSAQDASIGSRIATVTRSFAEKAVTSVIVFGQQLAAAPSTFSSLNGDEGGVVLIALRNLALVIVVTYGVLSASRLVTRRIDRSFGRRALSAGFFEKLFLVAASAAIDIGIVVVAWGAGYLAALTVFGDLGRMDFQQTLYLNAFTVVQLAKVCDADDFVARNF